MCTYDSVEVSDFLVAPFSEYHQSNLGFPKIDSVPGHRRPCLFHEQHETNLPSPLGTFGIAGTSATLLELVAAHRGCGPPPSAWPVALVVGLS